MTTTQFVPTLLEVQQYAWNITTVLVEHTDFDAVQATDAPEPSELELPPRKHALELLSYASQGMCGFHVEHETGVPRVSRTLLLFQEIAYDDAGLSLEAYFNPLAYAYLRELQTGIKWLRAQGTLSESTLAQTMQQRLPDSTLQLKVRRLSPRR